MTDTPKEKHERMWRDSVALERQHDITTLPPVYVDDEVLALANDYRRLSHIVYGRLAHLDGAELEAIVHLDGDIADLKSEIAEKERARSALEIRRRS